MKKIFQYCILGLLLLLTRHGLSQNILLCPTATSVCPGEYIDITLKTGTDCTHPGAGPSSCGQITVTSISKWVFQAGSEPDEIFNPSTTQCNCVARMKWNRGGTFFV